MVWCHRSRAGLGATSKIITRRRSHGFSLRPYATRLRRAERLKRASAPLLFVARAGQIAARHLLRRLLAGSGCAVACVCAVLALVAAATCAASSAGAGGAGSRCSHLGWLLALAPRSLQPACAALSSSALARRLTVQPPQVLHPWPLPDLVAISSLIGDLRRARDFRA